jgi:RNA polymerase sigma-70 factor (ECF subfamily)
MAEEEGLTRRAAQGEVAAFEEIVRMYQRSVYGVVLGMVGNPYDADDLTQEAFIRAHRRLAQFRGESSLKTWLTAIAVNAARDFLRRQRVRGWLALGRHHERTIAADCPGPEERLASRQLGQGVAEFMAHALSERERTVFSLRFIGGHSLAEIARITSSNLSTVKTHLYRALAKAREELGARGRE